MYTFVQSNIKIDTLIEGVTLTEYLSGHVPIE